MFLVHLAPALLYSPQPPRDLRHIGLRPIAKRKGCAFPSNSPSRPRGSAAASPHGGQTQEILRQHPSRSVFSSWEMETRSPGADHHPVSGSRCHPSLNQEGRKETPNSPPCLRRGGCVRFLHADGVVRTRKETSPHRNAIRSSQNMIPAGENMRSEDENMKFEY